MADKVYTSIIDAILDEREPDWKALNLKDEKKSGEDILERTHEYVDKDFIDEIAESASHHTAVPPGKAATLQERIAEKESAAPRVNSVKADWRKDARRDQDAYKSEHGDNDSLLDELTMTLDKAESEGKVEKKEWSDGQIQSYIKGLLNQGTSPSKVAAQLEKLAELELFNHQMATDYLQRNAGMLGLAYLEPNTFMDKQNPNYRHNAAAKRAGKFSLYTGPTIVKQTAERLREAGINVTVEGTENIHFIADGDRDGVTLQLREILGPQWGVKGLQQIANEPANVNERQGGTSNDCVRAHDSMKHAGIKPQAQSVKQIKACKDCSFFKKDASSKTCNLYHLPVVASEKELSQIVNHLTPGVPNNRKHAALVEIANRTDQHVQPFDAGKTAQTSIVKTADARESNQDKRQRTSSQPKFYAEHVAKLHSKGVSLKEAYDWASKKFGSVEVSVAFRGFVQSLRKNAKGRVVVASSDLKFLNSIGIRSESFEGGTKCASCPSHFGIEAKVEIERGAMRVDGKFAQRTASVVAAMAEEKPSIVLTAAKVRALHQKGHSLKKIFKSAAAMVGSLEAKKRIAEYIQSLKKTPGRISVNASDRSFLEGKLGFKAAALRTLDEVRPPADRIVASSGGSPILAYPGMEKRAAELKPTDGYAILNEYDLTVEHDQPIDIREPERLDVQGDATAKYDLE